MLAGRRALRGFSRHLKNVKTSVGVVVWTHYETLTGSFIFAKQYFFPRNNNIFLKQSQTAFSITPAGFTRLSS